MIILVPIEPLESRYSIQWKQWFINYFENKQIPYIVIDPKPLTTEIENGAFLDVIGTNYYKSCQLQEICRLIHTGYIQDNDTFLFHDAWFPGLEMLAYMRDGLGLKFKIAGCLHAGCWDPTDFISKKGMGRWGKDIENGWLELLDTIFVATKYHKRLICKNRNVNSFKIKVTGFPLYHEIVESYPKENIVVFPHRLTEDKQPHLFDKLADELGKEFPEWQFIKTQEVKRTKAEYYNLLNSCKVAVSYALHENWGIGMQEAVLCGCVPVVPDSLSYVEMYPDEYRYKHIGESIELVRKYIKEDHNLSYIQNLISFNGKWAITNMLKELL